VVVSLLIVGYSENGKLGKGMCGAEIGEQGRKYPNTQKSHSLVSLFVDVQKSASRGGGE